MSLIVEPCKTQLVMKGVNLSIEDWLRLREAHGAGAPEAILNGSDFFFCILWKIDE